MVLSVSLLGFSVVGGGWARDSSSSLIKGFHRQSGIYNSVWAELWGLYLGVRMARGLFLPIVVFEMVSIIIDIVEIPNQLETWPM